MNIKNFIKATAAFILMFALVFSLSNCNDDTEENDQTSDTVEEIIPVKKNREELIVNRTEMSVENSGSITDFENKHTPEITIGEKDEKGFAKIMVNVGSNGIDHPSTDNHWIDFMTLYIDGEEFKHIEIEAGEGSTKQEFFVPLENVKEVKVVLGCNIHGIWQNTKIVE